MCLLGEESTHHNFKGVLGLRNHLCLAGHLVSAKHVRRLVYLMGHESVYPKPRLTVHSPTLYSYLLRERSARSGAPNHLCADG